MITKTGRNTNIHSENDLKNAKKDYAFVSGQVQYAISGLENIAKSFENPMDYIQRLRLRIKSNLELIVTVRL